MNNNRRTGAWDKRQAANQLATDRPHPKHYSNGDELKFRHKEDSDIAKCHKNHSEELNHSFKESSNPASHKKETSIPKVKGKPSYLMSFTKGMPHNFETGLLNNPIHFQYFLRAIDSGDPRDFRDTPLGPEEATGNLGHCEIEDKSSWRSKKAKDAEAELRAWESQSAGLAFELEGPDAQAVTMPPAPSLGSDELTAEMAEVYVQALARDIPFNALTAGVIEKQYLDDFCDKIPKNGVANKAELEELHANKKSVESFLNLTEKLKHLPWFSKDELKKLSDKAETRRCGRQCPHPGTAFRGITTGDDVGPYLSQFLLIGNSGINGNDNERKPQDGYISYGAISIDQRVRFAKPKDDHMKNWEEWFDVQNAANLGALESYENEPSRRFIHTGRDLATYVHYDALYEAYLNACLILLGNGVKFDPGIPFQEDDNRDHQQGFAHFGGPHILSLVTEVATRALKAVRYQKYNIHRRCRPEVFAARITKAKVLKDMAPELLKVKDDLDKGPNSILDMINTHNGPLHEGKKASAEHPNYLLPMAFCEGSPMHPAYGAGHATVAGACITILKAFFDCNSLFTPDGINSDKAFVSVENGQELELVPVLDRNGHKAHLTVEGELNKLASNISIGRNWAGVHYFTDYYESLLMGEEIAIGILEEQKLMFGENFSMTIPLFGGGSTRI